MTIFYNKMSFRQDMYGGDRIKREIEIKRFTVDELRPNWVDIYIQ